jgi:hypothetical protein
MSLLLRVLLICAALFPGAAWADEFTRSTVISPGARLDRRPAPPPERISPNVLNFNLLSTQPIEFPWDGRGTGTGTVLVPDNAVAAGYTPDGHTIHISGEAAHLKYIAWRIDAPAATSSIRAAITIYKITNGQTSCRSGVPMLAAGKSLDATLAAGTIGTLPLGTDTSIPLASALCIAADGDFSNSAGTITIGIGP